MAISDEFVQVVDVTVITLAGERFYTIRPGDVDMHLEDGGYFIQFGPQRTRVGNEFHDVPGMRVTFNHANLVGIERDTRYEPKVRPSARLLADRERAETERIAQLLEAK